ncbi:MAG TPA: type II CAAX endopeptidase family protein [Polyangiales bacterium]|nr:type II CAAX endopeptidase family protein [Polyangiales bacterium]
MSTSTASPEMRVEAEREQPALVADKTSKFSRRYVVFIVALTAAWGVLMNQFGSSPIYWVMGPYSAGVCVALLVARGHALRARLRPTVKTVAIGVGMGALMTVCTYPAFDLARRFFPALAANVADLYRQSQNERLGVALVAVVVILTAEELLWRGAWFEAWVARIGPFKACALCVLSYALTQLCSGSFIVCLLAIVCGTVWTAMRYYTGSIVPSLIAHAIWTPTVILLIPVTWQ